VQRKKPDTMTMADITNQLDKLGVDVRSDYWSERDEERCVYVVPPAGKTLSIAAIEVRGDDVYVLTTEL